MGLLTSELNKNIQSDTKKFGYNVDQIVFKTDFPVFDYLNGQIEYKNNQPVALAGIDAGKSIMIIGKSGSGKSTLGIQLAYSVMKKYEESSMYIMDFEQSHTKSRIQNITGMTDEYFRDHIVIKKVGIYNETVYALIMQIAKFKKEHEKELFVENKEGVLDDEGKLVKILPPTFVFIDSIASMRPKKELDNDEESLANTAGAQAAKANTEMFNRILQPCMEANIIVISINHIRQNLSMGVTPPSAQTRYMKQDEKVSGGNAILYLSNLWLKIEAGTKLEEKDKYRIKGFEGKVTIIKSRNTEAGKSAMMIFNQREGFDTDLTTFEFLKANGAIKGAGVGLYFEDLPTTKFRMSNLKEKLNTDPEFRRVFDETTERFLTESLTGSSRIKTISEEAEKSFDKIDDYVPEETTEVIDDREEEAESDE